MSTQKVSFKNNVGHLLDARLDLPIDQHAKAYAIIAHCFTCNKTLTAIHQISAALTTNGFGVLRFDFTGLGESEGTFSDSHFSGNVQDLIAAAAFLKQDYKAPALLIGHSLGGAAVLFAANAIESIQAVATIAAPSHPTHVQHLVKSGIDEINEKGEAVVEIGGRPFTITKQFLNDLQNHDMGVTVKNLDAALLILHSPQDTTVSIDNAAELYLAAIHPKSFVSLDGADHLLSNKEDSKYVGDVIATWAKRYVSMPANVELKPVKKVMVQIGQSGFTSQVQAGDHYFLADEPIKVGGNNLGPTPYDFLLTALGSCTAMTIRMYADRKKWSVDEINVHLEHRQEHALDSHQCEDPHAKIDHIDRWLDVKGALDETQLARLLEIADKCPVHKTLQTKLQINTSYLNG